jgi:hypothetical protein
MGILIGRTNPTGPRQAGGADSFRWEERPLTSWNRGLALGRRPQVNSAADPLGRVAQRIVSTACGHRCVAPVVRIRRTPGTRPVITPDSKTAQVSDLGRLRGAGDENRTRALSLGSLGHPRLVTGLACCGAATGLERSAAWSPPFPVVSRTIWHGSGTTSSSPQ